MFVYLDHNASTPLDPSVLQAVQCSLSKTYGNPHSAHHRWGWDAQALVEESRAAICDSVGGNPANLAFTSGSTESICTVMRGFVGYRNQSSRRLVVGATEHDAVLSSARCLAQQTGCEVVVAPVDEYGRVDAEQLSAVLKSRKQTLVCLMSANNEIGTQNSIRQIANVVHDNNAKLLCDATQSWGKNPIDLSEWQADFVVFNAHKAYGPKGIGALHWSSQEQLDEITPLIVGGQQERGFRGGTLNVPAIAGMGEAARQILRRLPADRVRIANLRDRLESALMSKLDGVWRNGDPSDRLPNTSNLGICSIVATELLRDLRSIALSTQAACSSARNEPSHVLRAIGLHDRQVISCVRFSLGRFTTEREIEFTIDSVVDAVGRLRRNNR